MKCSHYSLSIFQKLLIMGQRDSHQCLTSAHKALSLCSMESGLFTTCVSALPFISCGEGRTFFRAHGMLCVVLWGRNGEPSMMTVSLASWNQSTVGRNYKQLLPLPVEAQPACTVGQVPLGGVRDPVLYVSVLCTLVDSIAWLSWIVLWDSTQVSLTFWHSFLCPVPNVGMPGYQGRYAFPFWGSPHVVLR